jgi:hypothetical protein
MVGYDYIGVMMREILSLETFKPLHMWEVELNGLLRHIEQG